jgi:type I restriction enzyme S subunit
MNDDLPEGWTTSTLGDVLEFKYGKGLPEEKRDKSGAFKVYGSNGVVGTHDCAVTTGPTIIVGRKGSVGEVHLSPEPCWPIDTTYFIDEFLGGISPQFWVFYLKHLGLGQQEKSSAIPGISRPDIYAATVVLPSLQEQRRIVAKTEALLARARSSQNRLDKIPTILKRFRQAVLAAACNGRLTEDWRQARQVSSPHCVGDNGEGLGDLPASWRWTTVESVCESIVDCPHSTPRWTASGRICVRTTNFKPGMLDLSEVRFVSEDTYRERVERLRPQAGDILYSREGGILGIACMVQPGVKLCLGQRMMLFRVSANSEGAFLMSWLNSPLILRRVADLTGGSASPHLNVGDIKQFPIPLPPPDEQREIGRRMQELFSLAGRLEARHETAKAHVDRLTQSVLGKAFRGELVTTEAELARREGREYETAEQLLARIRVQENTSEPARRLKKAGVTVRR